LNRSILPSEKLYNIQSAIPDFQRAAELFQKQGQLEKWQLSLQQLENLGAAA
jgi:hypothetical protein